MKDPDSLWLDIVNRFAKQSRCITRQVGAILVDKHNHLFGQGWNSAPVGSDTASCPRCSAKVKPMSGSRLDLAICVHAEINCIANAAKAGRSTEGATIYCTTFPCAECAKAIVTAGIHSVVYNHPYNSPLAITIFKNAGVLTRRFCCEGA